MNVETIGAFVLLLSIRSPNNSPAASETVERPFRNPNSIVTCQFAISNTYRLLRW